MSDHMGDYDLSKVIYKAFTTYRPSTGAAYTLAGTPAVAVYKDNVTTESTAGASITADFDSKTGLNLVTIDTSADGTFYSAGSFFNVVLSAGTIDGVSVVGTSLFSFTLRNDSALKPTTAGRALDVTTTGEAGLDFDNLKSTSLVTLDSLAITNGVSIANPAGVGLDIFSSTVPVVLRGATGGLSITTDAGNGISVDAGGQGVYITSMTKGISIEAGTGSGVDSHGIHITTAGSNSHGILAEGSVEGSVCDGIKVVAGTGGVDIRANITGSVDSVSGGVTVTANSDKTGYALTVDPPTAAQNATELLDQANAIETGWTVRGILRVMSAVLCGKLSGAATATNVFRSVTDGKDRVTSTVTADGDRSAVTLDGT